MTFYIYVRNFLNINELKNKIMSLHLFLDVGSKDSGHLWTRKITPRSEDGWVKTWGNLFVVFLRIMCSVCGITHGPQQKGETRKAPLRFDWIIDIPNGIETDWKEKSYNILILIRIFYFFFLIPWQKGQNYLKSAWQIE